jgi:hypothetical protein
MADYPVARDSRADRPDSLAQLAQTIVLIIGKSTRIAPNQLDTNRKIVDLFSAGKRRDAGMPRTRHDRHKLEDLPFPTHQKMS